MKVQGNRRRQKFAIVEGELKSRQNCGYVTNRKFCTLIMHCELYFFFFFLLILLVIISFKFIFIFEVNWILPSITSSHRIYLNFMIRSRNWCLSQFNHFIFQSPSFSHRRQRKKLIFGHQTVDLILDLRMFFYSKTTLLSLSSSSVFSVDVAKRKVFEHFQILWHDKKNTKLHFCTWTIYSRARIVEQLNGHKLCDRFVIMFCHKIQIVALISWSKKSHNGSHIECSTQQQ